MGQSSFAARIDTFAECFTANQEHYIEAYFIKTKEEGKLDYLLLKTMSGV